MEAISLSWLVVDTRCNTPDVDCYLDRESGCCYMASKPESKEELCRKNDFLDTNRLVLLPVLFEYSLEDAAEFLRGWCTENGIPFEEDLDKYDLIEAHYWGYQDYAEAFKWGYRENKEPNPYDIWATRID